MAKNTLTIDNTSRNRIVSETDKNFFVEAGAGSGKTTMLVNRMVAMVEQGKDISKICAITFTKAAAGEFYDRFQKLLLERSNPNYNYVSKGYAGELPAPTPESRELCEKALQNIDLCFMGTIDSFCNMVLSEHPFDAKIPSDATLVTDVELQVLYSRILVEIGEGKYGEELKSLYSTFRGVHRDAKEVFLQVIPQLMDRRNAHFNYTETKSVDFNKDFKAVKAELCRVLRIIEAHPELINTDTKESAGAWSTILHYIRSVYGNWNNNYVNVVRVVSALSKARLHGTLESVNAPNGDYVVFVEGKRVSYGTFSGTDTIAENLAKKQYGISMTFLVNCIPVIEMKMKEKGYLSYFDYLYYLRNMLKEDAKSGGKLAEYIYNRHSYYLIDEFQDTNPMQAEVFFYLCAKTPNKDWKKCVPKDGSLFIVGDPKQSIYRFRCADVTSFLNVKKLFTGTVGEVLYLFSNFRSTNQLIQYYNRVFAALLPEETDVQSKYEAIPEIKDSKDTTGTYIYKGVFGPHESSFPEEIDRVQIRKIVQTLVGNPNYSIHTPDEEKVHPIRYKDIMVITYGKKTLPLIMKELNDHNIRTKVEGKVLFEENEALWEIYRLYAGIANSKNEVTFYAALIGKIIGLTPDQLSKFGTMGGKIRVGESYEEELLKDEFFSSVYAKIQLVENLIYEARRLSPAALFAKIMEDFRIYTLAEASNIEILYYTLELMRNAERSGIIVSHIDGMNFLATLLSGESDEERCLSLKEERDCVHLANLHKLKGLEAPVVILAASPDSSHAPSLRIEYSDNKTEGYVFDESSPMDDQFRSTTYFSTNDYSEQSTKEANALTAEAKRLIYVAATRARNMLIISRCVKHRKTKDGLTEILNCRWLPLIEGDTPQFFEKFLYEEPKETKKDTVKASDLYEKAESESVLNEREAEGSSYTVETPSLLKVASKISEEDVIVLPKETDEEEDNKEERTSRRFPTLLGTSIHRLMELLVLSKNEIKITDAIDEIIMEYGTPENKSFEKELRIALEKVANTIQNGGYKQENEGPQDILSVLLAAEEVSCEMPFSFKEEIDGNTNIWTGYMDVIYKESGKWHIVDYKTNYDGHHLDLKYKEQLNAYIQAFKSITGEDADARIYHIDI